jgi:putative tricarboxylic transport membrane protein
MSDRIFGLVIVAVALGFIQSATQIQASIHSDPLGPKSFTYIVGGLLALCGLALVMTPDADPVWPGLVSIAKLLIAVAVLVAYTYALRPFGFLIPTALAAGLLSYQIEPRAKAAALTGLGLSIGLFIIFKFALGLGLVALPKW